MQNILLYFITVLIWGSTWYAITFQLGVVDPMVSVSYRFILAAALLFIFLAFAGRLKKAKFTPKQHGFLALQGVLLFSLNYWCTYVGTSYLASGLIAVLFSTMSMMNILNQALFFKIKIKKQVMMGSAVGLIGITFVFWPEITSSSFSDAVLLGIGFSIMGAYLASLGNMASLRNTRDDIPVMEANAFGMAYGGICSFMLALVIGAEINFDFSIAYMGSLFYLAFFGSAIAFGCYLTLIKRIGADKAAYAMILFPIVALLISTFFEGYVWSPQAGLGMVLVAAGNIISMVNRESLLHWRTRAAKKIQP